MRNHFGVCLGRSHRILQEKTKEIIQNVIIHHLQNVFINNFYDSEAVGVNCTPRCGGCKCGHCTIGSKSYSLKKERKLKLIEDGLKSEQNRCIATYLWIKEPNQSR